MNEQTQIPCPYCGHLRDAYVKDGENGVTKCDRCEKLFAYTIEFHTSVDTSSYALSNDDPTQPIVPMADAKKPKGAANV